MEAHGSTDGLDAARGYVERGWPIIPLRGKAPAVTGWRAWVATEARVLLFFGRRRCNIGLRTGESGYVVVDTDTDEAEAWAAGRLPATPMTARSGGGSVHRYFAAPVRGEVRNRQGWHGVPGLDVRGQGGFIVLPPSRHPVNGRLYEWIGEVHRSDGLPRFSTAWVDRRVSRAVPEVAAADAGARVRRARAYLARVEGAVSGQGGHNRTFRVACLLRRRFGLTFEEAWPLFTAWNETCEPPWSEAELVHKLEDAGRVKL